MSSNRYKCKELIGQGKTSLIYRAEDTVLNRHVALKCGRKNLISEKPHYQAVFAREAERLASLEHPNVLPIYDFGLLDQVPFLIFRFVSEGNLAQRVADSRRMAIKDVGAIATQVGAALDYCRSRGMAHRDVKPANLLIDAGSHVYLADFGLSCEYDSVQYKAGAGDVRFMAPEQIPDSQLCGIGDACDQFSLGVSLYLLLTCKLPLPPAPLGKYSSVGQSMRECTAFRLMCREKVLPTSQVIDIPRSVDDVLGRMLAVLPEDRFPTSCDAAESLAQAFEESPVAGTVFVSYCRADKPLLNELIASLQKLRLNFWWDQMIPAGSKWDEEIEIALDKADAMLVVLTPNSVESREVRNEWRYWIDAGKPIITLVVSECKVPWPLHRNQHIVAEGRPASKIAAELVGAFQAVFAKCQASPPQAKNEVVTQSHVDAPPSNIVPQLQRLDPDLYLTSQTLIDPRQVLNTLGNCREYIPVQYSPMINATNFERYLSRTQ